MTTLRRQASERSGRRSELAALWMLRLKGYRLLARRFKCPLGEIDLIMRRGQTTAFIEVKARAGDAFGHGLEAITWAKRREIAHVARVWLGQNPGIADACRFDAIAITWSGASHTLEHVEDAWRIQR